jgi:hypothetical protein
MVYSNDDKFKKSFMQLINRPMILKKFLMK